MDSAGLDTEEQRHRRRSERFGVSEQEWAFVTPSPALLTPDPRQQRHDRDDDFESLR